MDLAQTLVRSVVRAFYETRQVIVIDALVIHSALRDDDLAYIMRMNTKDLQKLCAKLRQDRLMHSHTRREIKEGLMKPINCVYYYIDYRQAIDTIKWRVYTVSKNVQGSAAPVTEKKEYFCSFCKAEWTALEVLDNFGPSGFLCHRCGSPLTHDLERNSTGHEQSTRLNSQLKFITDLLPRIDNAHIPDNNFEVAFANMRPVERDASNPGQSSVAVEAHRPAAVRGASNLPVSISVNISASNGPTDAEKAAEQERKEKAALQNALPAWMSSSTITGESFSGAAQSAAAAKVETKVKEEAKGGDKAQATMDDSYFARLKEQTALEARKMESPASGDEDEDEDEEDIEFEDV